MGRAARHAIEECLSWKNGAASCTSSEDRWPLADEIYKLTALKNVLEQQEAKDQELVLRPWRAGQFMLMSTLQQPCSGRSGVFRMRDVELGRFVAVKQMTMNDGGNNADASEVTKKKTYESIWSEVTLLHHLDQSRYAFSCEFYGLYMDISSLYIVTAVANMGDLFSWSSNTKEMGCERETEMRPIVVQMCMALRDLHDLGIAHRDVSLENFVLNTTESGELQVKLVDFEASSLGQICDASSKAGKHTYRAPEIHNSACYDSFLADAFALGVSIFCMATADYPWRFTTSCDKFFAFFQTYGFTRYLAERKTRAKGFSRLQDLLSSGLAELTEELLQVDPAARSCLGEACWQEPEVASSRNMIPRQSVWVLDWLSV
eukprot:TRINITY_DN85300_c0_g1_i1.p1 TRINITY_DN85300_c0_g1~~TRINITY_DN85300_c0_g1_i1.p1  ORF type:complete len:375 (+),score=55.96 TRINITY_DN85300_c0_g1_i1:152-1276(+)